MDSQGNGNAVGPYGSQRDLLPFLDILENHWPERALPARADCTPAWLASEEPDKRQLFQWEGLQIDENFSYSSSTTLQIELLTL